MTSYNISIEAIEELQEATKNIKRAGFMLEELMQRYFLRGQRPDPREAVEWIEDRNNPENNEKRFSAEWCFEHGRISEIMSMIVDYTYNAEMALIDINEEVNKEAMLRVAEINERMGLQDSI